MLPARLDYELRSHRNRVIRSAGSFIRLWRDQYRVGLLMIPQITTDVLKTRLKAKHRKL